MTLVIYGPTSTGKTNLAISLAKKFNGELISADSRQVYKNLDIGSGKVSPELKVEKHEGYWIVDGVKVYGFDLVNPGARFSASDFIDFTQSTFKKINKIGKLPIVVGGTAFYIKFLTGGFDTLGVKPDLELRSKLENLSRETLYKELSIIDAKKALSLNQSDRNNPRRLIRAIEIASSTLKMQPQLKLKGKILVIGLTAPSEFIYKKADKWIEVRFEKIIDEINDLLNRGVDGKWLESLGLEYRWGFRFIRGNISRNVSVTKLKFDTHDFIRRQKTWFKKFKEIKLFDITKEGWQNKLEKTIQAWYTRNNING